MKVTVALVGDPTRQESFSLEDVDAGEGTPYAELPAVTLEVSPDDTISHVLGQAAQHFGVTGLSGHPFSPVWISFYEPTHEHGYSRDGEMPYLTLVDSQGRALWGASVADPRVTMDTLHQAHEAGVVNGDPSRPYLLIRPTYGNGVLPDWNDLVVGFVVVREVLSMIADGNDAVSVAVWTRARVRRILDRMRRTPDILQDKSPDWGRRNGWPHEIDRLIRSRLWTSAELARLLDLSVADVDALLVGRGMTRDGRTGYWHMSEDAESRIVNEVYSFGLAHEWTSITETGEIEKVRTEIRRIVTRGMEPEADGS